jgi:hypothetical protein
MLNIFHFIGLFVFSISPFKFVFCIQVCVLHSSLYFTFEFSFYSTVGILHSSLYFIQVCILSNRNSIAIRFRRRKFSGDLVKMAEGNRSTTRSTPNLAEVARLYCCTDNVTHMQCSVLMYVFHSPISVE